MDPLHLKQLNAAKSARKGVVLLTNLDDGRDRLIHEGDNVAGALGEAIKTAFQTGKAKQVDVDGTAFFLNPHLPPLRIVAIGAVHITKALVPIAKIAGFDIVIIDPRTAFASEERFEDVELHSEWPQDIFNKTPLDSYCAVAALTHDPKIDDPALIAALEAKCLYIGALGSRKTHARRVERLSDHGFSIDEIGQIHAPIGLNIGASDPAEIAVSILAQIIEVLRKREVKGQE